MNKTSQLFLILVITAFLAASGTKLMAQRFKGAVMGGMNISQVDGDEVYGYHRFGGHIGVAAILPLNKWDVTLETVFNQKGSYQKPRFPADTLTGEYDLRLNYLEVPLMVHYTDREFITGGIGFSYGRMVYANEEEHGGNDPPYTDSVQFNKNDLSFLADVQIRVYKRLKFNVRFSYSLVPIRERTFYPLNTGQFDRKQYNNTFTFRLVYVINEKVTPRLRKDSE